MNRKILLYQSKFLVLLLSTLTTILASCTKYGTPTSDYHFFGRVTDDKNEAPIENIAVIIKENNRLKDSVITNDSGFFESNREISDESATSWEITIRDIDDSLNGSYYPSSISFITTNQDLSKSDPNDKWHEGTLHRNINFALHSKE